MPFTFKLSKRLALMKASLAACVALALACDRTDLTAPQSPFRVLTQVDASCLTSPGTWQNSTIPSQTGALEAQFDATPSSANMDAVAGLSSGPAADYTTLAAIVLFNSTGTIQARNGGTYAAAATILYSAGTTYHFRLDVDIPSHSYTVYVTPTGSTEQLLGSNFAFRTEQATVSVLDNLGLRAAVDSVTVRNFVDPPWTVPAAAVTVSPAAASILAGTTVQLAAVTKDSAGKTLARRTTTWTTSNSGVATVSASGLVTGVAAGSVTVTATSEGQSGTARVTVTAPNCLTSAGTWENSAIPAQTGALEAQFDATPSSANIDGVVGLSNGPAAGYTTLAAIVLFNSTGTIQARNGGTYAAAATILYSAGTTYHFRLDVDIPSHSYTVYVTPTGSTEQLLGSNFAFRTEQATVSVLDNLGLRAAVDSVTVRNFVDPPWTVPAAAVTVSPAAASILAGTTVQLAAVTKDSAGKTLARRTTTWTTSNSGVATVSASGLVTGVAAGSVTVTATSEGQSGTARVTVTAPNCLTSAGTWENSAIPAQTGALEA